MATKTREESIPAGWNRCAVCGWGINPDSGLHQLDEPEGACPECAMELEDMTGEEIEVALPLFTGKGE